jgi:hypothetical protein
MNKYLEKIAEQDDLSGWGSSGSKAPLVGGALGTAAGAILAGAAVHTIASHGKMSYKDAKAYFNTQPRHDLFSRIRDARSAPGTGGSHVWRNTEEKIREVHIEGLKDRMKSNRKIDADHARFRAARERGDLESKAILSGAGLGAGAGALGGHIWSNSHPAEVKE